jgi:hypothetical protein
MRANEVDTQRTRQRIENGNLLKVVFAPATMDGGETLKPIGVSTSCSCVILMSNLVAIQAVLGWGHGLVGRPHTSTTTTVVHACIPGRHPRPALMFMRIF